MHDSWPPSKFGSPVSQLVYDICVTVSLDRSADFTLQTKVDSVVGSTRWPAVQNVVHPPSVVADQYNNSDICSRCGPGNIGVGEEGFGGARASPKKKFWKSIFGAIIV